jgi:signal transduction histidine kinase/ActR/RegA family two-component response regulator
VGAIIVTRFRHGLESAGDVHRDQRRQEILLAQVRLLYANTHVGVGVTIIAAAILGQLESRFFSRSVVIGWWFYMALAAAVRYAVARRFRAASPCAIEARRWASLFALGAGFSGIGWGAAGILLYPEASLTNQVFLVFVVGGMMLGAASLLAPRPESFLAFLIPSGFGPAGRLLLRADQTHVFMGVLAAIFTVAVLITTWRIHQTLETSLRLQFENRDLVESLRASTRETEALNQALERRVQERTAELTGAAEQLRAEIANHERTEEELLRARKLESLGVLAGGIAHDFNNFLTIIQGNVEMARQHLTPGTEVQDILDETATACRRAAFLSSQLLTFAKGGAPVRRLVSMRKLVVEAIQLVRAGSSTSVTVEIAGDLLFALVDPGQIAQVLHNILLNAREAMRSGGVIEVRAENAINADDCDRDPRVRIAIRDYGCGIPADIRPRIFDPYFTTKPGSSGLGLATAYAIISKHGGNILVESSPGLGSVFTIDLPASYAVPAATTPVAANTQTGTERVLVMDDEEPIRKLLEFALRRLGYEVETARDGAEAIALYEEAKAAANPFDAVLLDLTVRGGMGGVEAAARLKELDPPCRLIVSSGYSASPVLSEFARYGFDAVLPKPWSMPDLSAVIRRVLARTPDQRRHS